MSLGSTVVDYSTYIPKLGGTNSVRKSPNFCVVSAPLCTNLRLGQKMSACDKHTSLLLAPERKVLLRWPLDFGGGGNIFSLSKQTKKKNRIS